MIEAAIVLRNRGLAALGSVEEGVLGGAEARNELHGMSSVVVEGRCSQIIAVILLRMDQRTDRESSGRGPGSTSVGMRAVHDAGGHHRCGLRGDRHRRHLAHMSRGGCFSCALKVTVKRDKRSENSTSCLSEFGIIQLTVSPDVFEEDRPDERPFYIQDGYKETMLQDYG